MNAISQTFALIHSSNLKFLSIQRSKIELIQSNVFENLVNLDYLDLSFNPIKVFETQAFNGLINLKSLNLKSIGVANFKSDDLCMLSFLPCKVDLTFDSDEFDENCAVVYLKEIKFRRMFARRQISRCANLNEELNACYKSPSRNASENCLSSDLIMADVQFVKKGEPIGQLYNQSTVTTSSSASDAVTVDAKFSKQHMSKFFNFKNKFNDSNANYAVKNNLIDNEVASQESSSTSTLSNMPSTSKTISFKPSSTVTAQILASLTSTVFSTSVSTSSSTVEAELVTSESTLATSAIVTSDMPKLELTSDITKNIERSGKFN